MKIKIDGEIYEVRKVHSNHGYLPMVVLEDNSEYYLAESTEAAGEKAREYWEDLAQDDPTEFACLVGEKTLVQWGMGHHAGPGSTQVKSLQEWLDLWLKTPEEQFASYDSAERECKLVTEHDFEEGQCACGASEDDETETECTRATDESENELFEELGFAPSVAYRHN